MAYPAQYQISIALDAYKAMSRQEYALAGRLFVRAGFVSLECEESTGGTKRYTRHATYCYYQLGQTPPELLELSSMLQ